MAIEPPQRPRTDRAPTAATPDRAALRRARSSTTPAASGSSRTPAAGRATGSCRWPSAGLAALGHRGAFGADGASSDGAGVSLPLDRPSLEAARAGRPGSPPSGRPSSRCSCRGRRGRRGRRARRSSSAPSPRPACRSPRWRTVPIDADRARWRGRGVAGPAFVQAFVGRPSRRADDARPIRRRLRAAARPRPPPARDRRRGRPGARRRCRRPVRLVPDDRLQGPRRRAPASPTSTRTCATPLIRVGYAVFHQRYATNTQPTWRLAQPFRLDRPQRRDQHGPRQPRAGPRPGGGPGRRRGRRASSLAAGSAPRPTTAPTRCRSTRRSSCSSRRAGTSAPALLDRDPRGARRCAARRIRTSPRSAAGRPASSRRGTARRRSSSPTAGASAPSSTGTGSGRRPSR